MININLKIRKKNNQKKFYDIEFDFYDRLVCLKYACCMMPKYKD